MKLKTTRKQIVSTCPNIVCAGYCDLQSLLVNHKPIAYTSGVYGWNFDVYEIDGLTICTGYRGMPGRCANNISRYEEQARAILHNYNRHWDDRRADVENLLHEFIKQA